MTRDVEPTETNNARLAREARRRLTGELPTAPPGSLAEQFGYEPTRMAIADPAMRERWEAEYAKAADRAAWLERRRRGIGASDIAVIKGWSTFADASPYKVWAEKVGLLPPGDEEERDIFEVGRRMEPMLKTWFEDRTGLYVAHGQDEREHELYPFAIATIDGEVFEHPGDPHHFDYTGEEGEPLGGVEFKTSREKPWDVIPDHYQCQGQWQMAVCGWERVWFAVLHNARTFKVYELERDDADIGMLLEFAGQWWEEHVIGMEPPPLDGKEATAKALRQVYPGRDGQIAMLSMSTTAAMLREAKTQAKKWEESARELESQIKEQMGDAQRAELGAGWTAKWSRWERTTIDSDRLKKDYPDAFAACAKKSPTGRLTLKDPEGEDEA